MNGGVVDWTPDLSVGVPNLDADHKKLVELLNRVFVAAYAGVEEEVLAGVLAELAAYTKDHFTREEAHLAQRFYPDLPAHKAEHDRLVAELAQISRRAIDERQEGMSADVSEFLRRWLVDHILDRDRAYAEYLKSL
ncbi:MAG: hemerythrin family protein [Rhodospirillales bacterium]|nr:hemerythrin family protein [Rhodospirillales bacterium]